MDEERIRRLENELAETGDPVVEASLRSARTEATRLREALSSATPLEDEPHDPTVVELGDTVTAREDGSNELERSTVVGKLEARLDLTWISLNSPLGSALLDSRPGQTVDVETPDGPMQYEVLSIEGASRSESRFPCRPTMTRNRLSSVRSSRKTARTWPIRRVCGARPPSLSVRRASLRMIGSCRLSRIASARTRSPASHPQCAS